MNKVRKLLTCLSILAFVQSLHAYASEPSWVRGEIPEKLSSTGLIVGVGLGSSEEDAAIAAFREIAQQIESRVTSESSSHASSDDGNFSSSFSDSTSISVDIKLAGARIQERFSFGDGRAAALATLRVIDLVKYKSETAFECERKNLSSFQRFSKNKTPAENWLSIARFFHVKNAYQECVAAVDDYYSVSVALGASKTYDDKVSKIRRRLSDLERKISSVSYAGKFVVDCPDGVYRGYCDIITSFFQAQGITRVEPIARPPLGLKVSLELEVKGTSPSGIQYEVLRGNVEFQEIGAENRTAFSWNLELEAAGKTESARSTIFKRKLEEKLQVDLIPDLRRVR